jgi:ribosomal protein S18 acetylase RimI-like enzyme
MIDINVLSLKEVDYDDLFKYISSISRQFKTPLEQRTSLDKYTHKLITYGDGYIARSGDNFAGIIAGYNNDILKKEAYISLLFVSPELRGYKIGHMLLDAFVNRAQKQEMKTISVFTNSANTEALGLYRKHGFSCQILPESNDYLLIKKVYF